MTVTWHIVHPTYVCALLSLYQWAILQPPILTNASPASNLSPTITSSRKSSISPNLGSFPDETLSTSPSQYFSQFQF